MDVDSAVLNFNPTTLTILNVLIKNNELWTDEKSVSAV